MLRLGLTKMKKQGEFEETKCWNISCCSSIGITGRAHVIARTGLVVMQANCSQTDFIGEILECSKASQ